MEDKRMYSNNGPRAIHALKNQHTRALATMVEREEEVVNIIRNALNQDCPPEIMLYTMIKRMFSDRLATLEEGSSPWFKRYEKLRDIAIKVIESSGDYKMKTWGHYIRITT